MRYTEEILVENPKRRGNMGDVAGEGRMTQH
jgi:hypothetical protein